MASNQSQKDWQNTAVRLPREVHQALQEQAKKNDRSFNGQVVAILRAAVKPAQEAAS